MRTIKLICLLSLGIWAGVASLTRSYASGTATTGQQTAVNFERDIRPLLHARCVGCHGPQTQKSGLRLDQKAPAFRGGASGPAIIPGKAGESKLIRRVTSGEKTEMMPPAGERLSPREIAVLRAWIDAGAEWPEFEKAASSEPKRADKSTWWSLQPIRDVSPPNPSSIPQAWSKSPIDRFIYQGLAERGLAPSPEADRKTLIRRATYDLTGLPPTPEDVAAFIADSSPDAYEKLVDRLLASPRYGEQWGRHWLDVVRFGESKGYEQNHIINNLWPYRDYVIRSMNEDKPFNRFIIEQLAGDVIGKGDPSIEVGTAFLVCGPYDSVGNQDVVQQRVIRSNTLDDLITATSNAFLGLSVNCARCHFHKFDPIPQEDYYRLRAAFEGVTHSERIVATEDQQRRYAAVAGPLETQKAALTKEKAALEKDIAARALKRAAERTIYPLPAITRQFNEHKFAPIKAKRLKFKILANSDRPKSGENARIDEFEAWTSDGRNVALASVGTKVEGATLRRAEDIAGAEAYGIDLTTDGKFGERWIAGSPPELNLIFPKSETLTRIVFSHDRTAAPDTTGSGLGPFVTEYQALISEDGVKWTPVADSRDRTPFNEAHAVERFKAEVITPEEQHRLLELETEIARLDRELKAIPPLPLIWAGKFEQPKETTYLQKGGDPERRGAEIIPASLAALDRSTKPFELKADAPEGERRLALARWIVSDDNPLTARVLANRIWHYHFGTGIVDTPSDFGYLGGKPTHPELLDWLAKRLQSNGWRVKPLHREILLSQTYRQSGERREDAARQDGAARMLWRFPPRRLQAEEIRDTMLTISGKLDEKMGGPGFRLYRYLEDNVATYQPLDRWGPETYRRAVYHQNARSSVIDVLSDFDLPDNAASAPNRISTTSPLQALTLLNHRFMLEMADALSDRAKTEAQGDETNAVQRVFELAFQRSPTAGEQTAARKLIREHGWRAFTRAILNANELLYLN